MSSWYHIYAFTTEKLNKKKKTMTNSKNPMRNEYVFLGISLVGGGGGGKKIFFIFFFGGWGGGAAWGGGFCPLFPPPLNTHLSSAIAKAKVVI